MSAETIASVSGILIVNVVPAPGVDFRSTVPPICSMLARTTSMPTPRPEMLVIVAAVEKPGMKMKLPISASDLAAISLSVAKPLLDGFGADARQIKAAAVVGDLDNDVTALMAGRQADGALLRLAGREPFRRRSRCRDRHNCAPDA